MHVNWLINFLNYRVQKDCTFFNKAGVFFKDKNDKIIKVSSIEMNENHDLILTEE